MSGVKRQAREGFEPVDSKQEAMKLLENLEEGETMLKSVVQGDGMLAGGCDEVRDYGHDGELQVQPPLVGHCNWVETEKIAEDMVEKQLPVKVVEWEDRI